MPHSLGVHHELPIRFPQIERLRHLRTKYQHRHYLRPSDGVRYDDDAYGLVEPVHFVPFCSRTIQIARGYSLDAYLCFSLVSPVRTKMTKWATTLSRPNTHFTWNSTICTRVRQTISISFTLTATQSTRNETFIHGFSFFIWTYFAIVISELRFFRVSQKYALILYCLLLFSFLLFRVSVVAFWQLRTLPL